MTDIPPAPTRLSKAALFSLIFGILICIPFGGVLAVLLGLIGFFTAAKPGMRGRWMAVVGGLVGLLATIVWISMIALMGWGIFSFWNMTQPPRTAAHDFIKDLTAGDVAAAKEIGPGFDDAALQRIETYCKTQGTFVDTTFTTTNIENDTAHLEGTVKFSGGVGNVTVDEKESDGKWQVTNIEITPP